MADVRDEQQWLARLTVDLDCAQQRFFQAEYGRHRRSPTVALLLCLLLGDFGAHEFYFGRLTSGLLRLLFCWTFIPWLIALVESPKVPGYARRYNAELAQGIVDMLHEVRAHVRALDPAPAPVYGAANVVVAPAVAPIVLGADDARRIRTASADAPTPAANDDDGGHGSVLPQAALAGGAGLAALSAIAAEAVGYRRQERASDTPAAQATQATPVAAPVAAQPPTPATQSAPAARADRRASDHTEDYAADAGLAAAGAAAPVFAYSMGRRRHEPVRYGPPLDAAPASNTPAAQPMAQPPARMRRIVVRKVALVDGKQTAEAIATREVALDDPTSPYTLEERIQRATDEARDEALRQLAARVSDDVRHDAAQQFGEYA